MLESTGQQLVRWAEDAAVAYEHVHRYAYATQFVAGRRVLDMGCGDGSGAAMMAERAARVVGVDVDSATIQRARDSYGRDNIEFTMGSLTELPVEETFDVIVCFETLERVRDRAALVAEAQRLLAPGGMLVVSAPVSELNAEDFRKLLGEHFSNVRFLGQRVVAGSSLWPEIENRGDLVSEFLLGDTKDNFRLSDQECRTPVYHVALAANTQIPAVMFGSVLVDPADALIDRHTEDKKRIEALEAAATQTARERDEALARKDSEIENLRATIRRNEEALESRSSQLAQASQRNRELEESIRSKDGRIRELEGDFIRLRIDLGDVSQTLYNTRHGIDKELEAVRDECDERLKTSAKERKELAAIKNSFAWKLVSPFLPSGSTR